MTEIIKSFEKITSDWKCIFLELFGGEYFDRLKDDILLTENMYDKCVPQYNYIFKPFELTPFSDLKVVLIDERPYSTPGYACGLSYSTFKNKKIPGALMNIYKCLLEYSLICDIPNSGDLSEWAERGCLLLNTNLTTLAGEVNSHKNIWSGFSKKIVKYICDNSKGIHFILLGRHCEIYKDVINDNHIIHEWSHPSPLSRQSFIEFPGFYNISEAIDFDWEISNSLQ